MLRLTPYFNGLLRSLRAVLPRRYLIIHGFYGTGNVGDEAILAATLEEVRRVTDLEPFVFAWHPERVRADFGVPSLNPNRSRPMRTLGVLLRAEAYLLGGGGLIKDYGGSPESLSRWLCWPALAGALGVKTMLWSVGVENVIYEASKERLRQVLAGVDVVTVRDPSSRDRLNEIGIRRPVLVTADPVPHYARAHGGPGSGVGERKQTGNGERIRKVAVCPRHWYTLRNTVPDEPAFDQLIGALAGSLDAICERHGSEVVFVPFRTTRGDDDRTVCAAIAKRMKARRVAMLDAEDPGVQETLEELASADLVIAMRLHAAVMATALGIPTVAISYMPKVADYMASIGQAAFCTEVGAASVTSLGARVDEVIARYDTLSAELRDATADLSERFLNNGRLLADLLNDRLS